MNLAIIPPRSMVKVSSYGDWAFCLGQEAIRDMEYREYFCHCPLPVILDNGAFEGDLPSIQDYFMLARLLRPRIVILPDALNDSRLTDELVHRSIGELVKLADPRPLCLAVPQGRTVDESVALTSKWAIEGLPVQGLALSFKGLGQDGGFTRSRYIEQCESLGLLRSYLFGYVHLLGHENDWRETEALARTIAEIEPELVMHSLDTAEPVRHALADFDGEPELGSEGWLVDRPREAGYFDSPRQEAWGFSRRLEQYALHFRTHLNQLFD